MTTPTHLDRITAQPGHRFAIGASEVVLMAPHLIDADDPDEISPGDLSLGVDDGHPGWITPTSGPEAVRLAVAILIAQQLHEVAEWIRYDGERVFIPHTDPNGVEWDVISRVAMHAAETMLSDHPLSIAGMSVL